MSEKGHGPGDGDWGQDVRRKSNNVRDFRVSSKRQARKSAGKAPEVMAKVTGFSKGASHTKSHLDYISRNGDVAIENERGQTFKSRDEVKEMANEWVTDFKETPRHKNQRDTMHLILSMPEGTDPEAVRRATRNFARETFKSNYEYVFALHTDTNSPHTHLTVKMLGHDGKRLNPRKADLQAWREKFAEKMEQEGYMADATPRFSRGVVKKSERQVIRHIEKRGTSQVQARRVKEVAGELIADAQGKAEPVKPWIARITERQQQVRAAWLAAAERLERGEHLTPLKSKDKGNDRAHTRRVRSGEPAGRLRGNGTSNERGTTGAANGGAVSGAERMGGRNPEHRKFESGGIRAAHRFAALYQSGGNDVDGGRGAPPANGLRELSRVPMAQDQGQLEVLLHPDARDSLENRDEGRTDFGMRRTGASPDGIASTADRLDSTLDGKDLAQKIRQFVDAMPPIETRNDSEKAALAKRFTMPAVEQRSAPAQHPQQVNPSSPAPVQQKPDRDIER